MEEVAAPRTRAGAHGEPAGADCEWGSLPSIMHMRTTCGQEHELAELDAFYKETDVRNSIDGSLRPQIGESAAFSSSICSAGNPTCCIRRIRKPSCSSRRQAVCT